MTYIIIEFPIFNPCMNMQKDVSSLANAGRLCVALRTSAGGGLAVGSWRQWLPSLAGRLGPASGT
jgi:hypothetical protein